MLARFAQTWRLLTARLHDFRSDQGGQILILFGLSSVAIFAGLAASFDLSKAYAARQRLSEVATLACQYSSRGSVGQTATSTYSGSNGFQTYVGAVNAFVTTSLTTQHWNGTQPTGGTANPNSYFTATAATGGTSASANVPSNPVVELTAAVPTSFGQILNVSSIPVHAKIACPTLATALNPVNPPNVKEGFESGCGYYCFTAPSGASTYSSPATNTFPASAGYIGDNKYQWYIVGYCLEIDVVGVIDATTPEGTHSAELDCDNGHGSAGNSSISTKVFLTAGQYELRYNYRSRIDYIDYDPTYICGSTASDVSWANDANAFSPGLQSFVPRTNQINVYLDANLPGNNGVGSAPLHQTIDTNQYLAGGNLIDTCVYSPTWVERSIRVKVANPGYYWLSFAADGASDSYGGQLDNIRLCQELCSGTVQDNFPSAWLAANNSGSNKVLFEDTFESPHYTADYSNWISKSGNLNNSYGTSGSASSGWPSLGATGWATAPYNQVNYMLQGAQQGSQYVSIDGYNGYSSGNLSRNRMMSRPFLLDPGYYSVSYQYVSDVNFAASNLYGTYCTAAPSSGFSYPAIGTTYNGYIRFYQSQTADINTNILGVFMSSGQLVSTPISGGALGSVTSYTNPDGSVSTTPTVQPDYVNWLNYNGGAVNPLLDTCGYADSFRWIPRTISIKITKPGLYWLTFSAYGGAADGNGPGIDDVKLTALGSPYMSSPPSAPLVAIPVPDPQPDSIYTPGTYPGFTIVADPFTPPGADQ